MVKKNKDKDKVKVIKNNKIVNYFSFNKRLIIYILLFLITMIASIYFFVSSFKIISAHVVNYNESSNIDYKVHIRKNDFYESEYLDKNMSYISSLIEDIDTTFNYDFNINEKSNLKFVYDVVGTLQILDSNGVNTFYTKNYNLIDSKEVNMNNDKKFNINEKIVIDYNYYNSIANQFRNNFGVSTISNLIVTMNVKPISDDDLNINKSESFSLTIPLSQREVTIKLTQNSPINNNEVTLKDSSFEIDNIGSLIIGFIFLIITNVIAVKIIRKIRIVKVKKSKYDSLISKVLKEYDRLIVNTNTAPIIKEDDKVIMVDDFQELVDVRDNLKSPIMYYNIADHQKCMFYINSNNLVYIYKLKSIDLEEE